MIGTEKVRWVRSRNESEGKKATRVLAASATLASTSARGSSVIEGPAASCTEEAAESDKLAVRCANAGNGESTIGSEGEGRSRNDSRATTLPTEPLLASVVVLSTSWPTYCEEVSQRRRPSKNAPPCQSIVQERVSSHPSKQAVA